MGLFAEVFDTTRNEPEEMAAARTILMLGALQSEPCSLASIHALNSRFILDGCRDPEFYCLVCDGRIRFHRRKVQSGGPASLRAELIHRMGDEPYFCYGWPETFDRESGRPIRSLCLDVRRRLSGKKVSIKDSDLEARIESALELFAAIERAPHFEETGRTDFHGTVRAAIPGIPRDEKHVRVRQLISQIAGDDRIRGRSIAYKAIEAAAFDGDTKKLAKDVIDGCYNSAVARSLKARFLSSRRLIDLGGNFHRRRSPLRSVMTYVDQPVDATSNLSFLVKQPITWRLVHETLSIVRDFDLPDLKIARRRLAENLADKSPAVLLKRAATHGTLQVGAGAVIGATTGILIANGGIADWFLLSTAALTFASATATEFVKLKQAKEAPKAKAAVIERQLAGWLDRDRHND